MRINIDLKELKNILSQKQAKNPHLPYWLITINNGLKEYAARVEWCEESIELLKKEK